MNSKNLCVGLSEGRVESQTIDDNWERLTGAIQKTAEVVGHG